MIDDLRKYRQGLGSGRGFWFKPRREVFKSPDVLRTVSSVARVDGL